MRLLQKLTQRRDFHLAEAGKYSELIALLEGDGELQRAVAHRATKVIDQARALHHAHVNGNGNGAAPKKRSTMSPKERKRAAARMRKLWRTSREKMLRSAKAGAKKGRRAREAAAAAAAAAVGAPMPPV